MLSVKESEGRRSLAAATGKSDREMCLSRRYVAVCGEHASHSSGAVIAPDSPRSVWVAHWEVCVGGPLTAREDQSVFRRLFSSSV